MNESRKGDLRRSRCTAAVRGVVSSLSRSGLIHALAQEAVYFAALVRVLSQPGIWGSWVSRKIRFSRRLPVGFQLIWPPCSRDGSMAWASSSSGASGTMCQAPSTPRPVHSKPASPTIDRFGLANRILPLRGRTRLFSAPSLPGVRRTTFRLDACLPWYAGVHDAQTRPSVDYIFLSIRHHCQRMCRIDERQSEHATFSDHDA